MRITIEMHGFVEPRKTQICHKLWLVIGELNLNAGPPSRVVVSQHEAFVCDHEVSPRDDDSGPSEDRPFLRLYCTDPDAAERIRAQLRSMRIGVDLEVCRMQDFIPGHELA